MPDVSKDPRYIKVVEDVRSELAVPMLLKDRCIGVFDLESPELDAFSKRDVEILTLLASQAAVAIENAGSTRKLSANEARLERELKFAKRVQAALLPSQLPKKVKGVDLGRVVRAGARAGRRLPRFPGARLDTLVIALGDVSGKGVPAALYSVFAGELVRGRTFRRRYLPEQSSPGKVLMSINTILHERQLEEYYCTLCYAMFDLKRRTMTLANSGVPYPIRATATPSGRSSCRACRSARSSASSYDEVTLPLAADDVFVFCVGRRDGSDEPERRGVRQRAADRGRARDAPPDGEGHRQPDRERGRGHRAGAAPNDDTTWSC